MDITHIEAFTAAMQRKNLDAMLTHMADDVVLKTPLLAEPVRGKTAIRAVVTDLFRVVEGFDFQSLMSSPERVSSFFKVRAAGRELDGMDYWRLNDAGLIVEMTVLWRPLPEAEAVRDVLMGLSARPA